jgi:hypothetical protein
MPATARATAVDVGHEHLANLVLEAHAPQARQRPVAEGQSVPRPPARASRVAGALGRGRVPPGVPREPRGSTISSASAATATVSRAGPHGWMRLATWTLLRDGRLCHRHTEGIRPARVGGSRGVNLI